MSGIIFYKTMKTDEIRQFYTNRLGVNLWLEQSNCFILKDGNLLLGFCSSDKADTCGIITFFYRTKEEVDNMYRKLEDIAIGKPKENKRYDIYHFFANDPEGRVIEFQSFLHSLNPYLDCMDLLITRRSIRNYEDRDVPEGILNSIFEICRYSPTSRNSQSFYFIVIRDRTLLDYLSSRRGESSAPIARAPIAVLVASDPSKTLRYQQDADIAAYHFILSAHSHGLGTCWIGGMDRDDVKETLNIPKDHYVAMITPLGYSKEVKSIPERRRIEEFVRFI